MKEGGGEVGVTRTFKSGTVMAVIYLYKCLMLDIDNIMDNS
jgi:hypothetical protein